MTLRSFSSSLLARKAGLLVLTLCAGCAHIDRPLPVCDGASRRPANPHGSVLSPQSPAPPPVVAEPPASGGCA